MIVFWIIVAILTVCVLKYVFLFFKRFILLAKVTKHTQKRNGKLQYVRHPLYSIFRHDSKPDLCIHLQDKTVFVTVITTPFRRVRYHFNQNDVLELVHERRGIFITNPRRPNPTATMDRSHVIRQYPMAFSRESSEPNALHYVILHPAPHSATKVDGSRLAILHDNDILFENIRICGLQYFLKNVMNDIK